MSRTESPVIKCLVVDLGSLLSTGELCFFFSLQSSFVSWNPLRTQMLSKQLSCHGALSACKRSTHDVKDFSIWMLQVNALQDCRERARERSWQSFFLTGSLCWLLRLCSLIWLPWRRFALRWGRLRRALLRSCRTLLRGCFGPLAWTPNIRSRFAALALLLRATRTTLHESHHGMPLEYASPPRKAFHASVL